MKRCKAKLRSNQGETLVELLASVLIATLSVALLIGCVTASFQLGRQADQSDSYQTALTAAETGHLVFGTVHTNSAADSIDRIVDVFPAERQQQIRLQLSMTLKAVLSQQLLPRAKQEGRVLACEVMKTDDAIRNLIREGKTPQIQNAIQTSGAIGNILMDRALQALYRSGTISQETLNEALRGAPSLSPTTPSSPLGLNRPRGFGR